MSESYPRHSLRGWKATHAQEDREAAREKTDALVAKLQQTKLAQATQLVRDGMEEMLSYYGCLRGFNVLDPEVLLVSRVMRTVHPVLI